MISAWFEIPFDHNWNVDTTPHSRFQIKPRFCDHVGCWSILHIIMLSARWETLPVIVVEKYSLALYLHRKSFFLVWWWLHVEKSSQCYVSKIVNQQRSKQKLKPCGTLLKKRSLCTIANDTFFLGRRVLGRDDDVVHEGDLALGHARLAPIHERGHIAHRLEWVIKKISSAHEARIYFRFALRGFLLLCGKSKFVA